MLHLLKEKKILGVSILKIIIPSVVIWLILSVVIFSAIFSSNQESKKNDMEQLLIAEQQTSEEEASQRTTEDSQTTEQVTTEQMTSTEQSTNAPTTTQEQTTTGQVQTTTRVPTTESQTTTQVQSTQAPNTQTQTQPPTNAPTTIIKPSGIGALQVIGTNLCDSQGTPIQLKGVSTHGINWFPQYVNLEAFSSLKNYGANAVRLAMYTNEYNGYCSGGNKSELKNLIQQGVHCATQLGMYVIIDWHILSDGNPNTYLSEAIAFFAEISAIYKNHTNVIYEICNEPNGAVSWDYDIKPYAEKVIDTIRANDKDAVIIVGTPTWSQDVDIVANNPLDTAKYQNIMYALHFYAATHYDYNRDKLVKAYQKGLPMFVSEFSICEASGNGRLDTSSGNTWINMLDSYGISYMSWSLANKAEAASLLNSWCNKTGGFAMEDFSECGKWYLSVLAK